MSRTARSVTTAVLPAVPVLAAAAAVRYRTLRVPLLEAHPFRQTQTAFTARIFHTDGIDLLHPHVPVLGEPWAIPFEFPLFQALATLPMNLGLPADPSMRITALALFLLTAALVYGLMRHVTQDVVAAVASTVFFCFAPFSLLWSRASLIEYLATAAGLATTLFGVLWWDRRHWYLAAVAAGCGVVGMLVKPTTAVWGFLPIVGWVVHRHRAEGSSIRGSASALLNPGLAAVALPGLVAAWLWTRHADAVKQTAPATRWLTSEALTTWNFGTLDQRRVAQNWVTVLDRAEQLLVGRYVWIGLVLLVLAVRPRRWFWWSVAVAAVLPIAIFFNLYVVHDYYLAALSPGLAMLMGAGVGHIAARAASITVGRLVGAAVVVAWLASSLWSTSGYWMAAYRQDLPAEGPPLAAEIRQATKPSARVVVLGLDWEPTVLYYADRRGAMIVDAAKTGYPTAPLIRDLRRLQYRTLAANDPFSDPIQWTTAWPWVGPIGPRVYRVGEGPGDLGGAPVLATSIVASFDRAAERGSVVARDLTVPCGTGLAIAAPGQALWLRFAPVTEPLARIVIDPRVAPLPPVAVAVIPRPVDGLVHVGCSGAGTVTIEAAVAGEPPST